MKLNKTMRKLVAYVCTLAMIVTSMTINPTNVDAADVPEGYTLLTEQKWHPLGETVDSTIGDDNQPASEWNVYTGNDWTTVSAAVKDGADGQDTVSVFSAVTTGAAWGLQLGKVFKGLESGTTYSYVINYTIDGVEDKWEGTAIADANGQVKVVKDIGIMLVEGQTLTVTSTSIEEPDTSEQDQYVSWLTTDRNLAYGKTATVSSWKEGNSDTSVLVDGTWNLWSGNYVGGYTPGYFEVDLGNTYEASSIDQVVIWFRNGDPNLYPSEGFRIQFGDAAFETAATVTEYPAGANTAQADGAQYMVATTIDKEAVSGTVKKVRIQVDQNVGWGTQIAEIAVFAENPVEGEVAAPAENPAAVTVTSEKSSDVTGAIKVNITAGENQEGYTYLVYLDDATTATLEGCVAGTDYIISGVSAGTHTVKVVSLFNGGASEGIVSEPVEVKTILEDVTDATKNLAYGKTWELLPSPESTYPSGSAEGNGDITNGTISGSDFVCPIKDTAGAYYIVDLGAEVDASLIDSIFVWYRVMEPGCAPQAGNSQDIKYSTDKETWTDVASVSGADIIAAREAQGSAPYAISTDVSEATGTVRYIQIYYPSGVTYGAQVTEIAVFGETPAEEPSSEEPSSEEPSSEEPSSDEPSSEEPSLYPAAVGTHEAENAAQVNFTKTPEVSDYYANCSGSGIVGVSAEWINNAKKYITQQVEASEAGKYQLTLQYCAPKAVEFLIQVNDSEWTYFDEVADVVGHVSPATGGWNAVGTVTTEIELVEGVNTINISGPVVDNSTADGNFFTVYESSWNNSTSANLDCFTISKIEEESSSDEPSSDESSSDETSSEEPSEPSYDPGFNPAELTYTNLVCDGNAELSIDYSIQSGTIVGLNPWYGDNGVVFQLAHQNAIATEILVNGQAPTEGFVVLNASGIVKINPTLLEDNAYSVITMKTEDEKDLTLVIKKGTPVVEDPSDDPSSDEPSSDEPSSDVPVVEYTPLGNGGTVNVADWELYNSGDTWNNGFNSMMSYVGTTNDDLAIKIVASSGSTGSWELQAKKSNASIYEGLEVGKTYKVITTLDSTEAGNILVKLEGFDEGNTYPVVAGANTFETVITYNGTPGGFAVLELSGMPSGTVISNVAYTFEETEAPPETTTPEPTSNADGFVTVNGANADITGLGNWGMWISSTHTMEIKVDEEDSDHIQARIVSNNGNWDVWSAQYKISKYGLTPGAEYTMSVDVKGDSADFAPTAGGVNYNADKTLTEVTVEMKCTADENGAITGIVGIGVVGIGVTLDLSNIVVKDADGNVVEVLDEAPVVETTTPPELSSDETTPDEQQSDETTTPEPTTPSVVDPTTTDTTTVAPTTTTKKVTPPKKTKVKKATKKKAAKKVKLSIKKVKEAKGYKVQFSKKKKFTKKNILVTKIVKKAKVTVSNKKLKKAKKLFVRVKAYKLDGKKKVWAKKWSKPKKVKIKK